MSTAPSQKIYPIVGAHFRPPAKQLLMALPGGAGLLLVDDSDNPYDPAAIKVLVDPRQVPPSIRPALAEDLQGTGHSIDELMAAAEDGPDGWVHIGFIAASGGKPLAKLGFTEGNAELRAEAASSGLEWPLPGRLGFTAEATPVVLMDWVPEGPEM